MQDLAAIRAIAATVRRDRAGAGMRRFVDYWSDSGTWNSLPQDKRFGLARLATTSAENFDAAMAEAIPLETYRRIQVPALLLRGAGSPAPAGPHAAPGEASRFKACGSQMITVPRVC